MTTIAYKDGILASDSQTTDGNLRIIGGGLNKFRYLLADDGTFCWLATAGDLNAGNRFVAWFMGANPDLKDEQVVEFEALVLYDDGVVELYSSGLIPNLWDSTRPIAIGTGAGFAMAAMACGKSAAEAVELACDLDIYSARPVQFSPQVAAPPAPV